MGLRQLVIDTWSALNYKPIYADPHGMPHRRAFPEARSVWVPAEDERRLAAYKLFAAYDGNQAAEMHEILDGPSARERREFGAPSMMIDTLVSHVLGDGQHITVPGAEHDSDDPPEGAAMAQRVQELLRDWADTELLPMRMLQCERKAVALGDGVYRLAWDPARQRPTVRVTDPGFYFPVIGEDDDGGEFPTRVHFAWELPEDTKRGLKPRLRRITYELDWIRPATVPGVDTDSRPVRAPALHPPQDPGDDTAPDFSPVLTRGDILDTTTGAITRQYPWNDGPSVWTCYLTDATWLLSDLRGPLDIDTLPMTRATFATRSDGEVLDHLDLLIDFIPVIHVPNTVPSAEEHWGMSSLAKVLQVLDELASSDTDSARASAITGSPIISISGKNTTQTGRDKVPDQQVAPGLVFRLGEGGRMDALDTAPQLAELRNHVRDLHDRVASTARLPAVSMGTADPAKYPSGYALQLALGPLDSLISVMRLARDHKDRLLLKFAQRLFIAGQHPDWAGVTVQPASIDRGPYTPTDKQAVLTQVAAGFKDGVMSLETGIKMLQSAGFPIQDAQTEIEQIQSRRFADAVALANATGSTEAVGDYLGLDINPDPTPPTVVLPPTPGQEPATDPANTPPGSGNSPRSQSRGNES